MTMEQALYRKYRPKSFDEAVGQEHITHTLQRALKAGRISHAYLFTGPRGVGKTSVARILAHEVNQLPYTDDSVHLDIIEIDAASNRRIDEIRDLRDKVRIAPAAAKYKVYIIDEVHMLTREAFNALLKTLEEPPAHCIFILATTESHKLPQTIISRTQRHEFKPVNKVQMASHLGDIAKKEKIDIERSALDLLAEYGEGSFRDSIGYLDQLSSSGQKVTEEAVREVLGMPAAPAVAALLAGVRSGEVQSVYESLLEIQGQGAGPAELASALSKNIRDDAASGSLSPADIKLLKNLVDIKGSLRPAELLEIALLESAAERSTGNAEPKLSNPNPSPQKTAKSESPKETHISSPAIKQPETEIPAPVSKQNTEFNLTLWPQVVSLAKEKAASIYTALKLAHPSLEDGKLSLAFEFPLHQKKLEQAKNKALVADIIYELTGQKIIIDCVVNKNIKRTETAMKDEPNSTPLQSISNIFGTAEVMEA